MAAPIPTIFVGGNHEASSYLQEMPYGGWVAPNIWFMGMPTNKAIHYFDVDFVPENRCSNFKG